MSEAKEALVLAGGGAYGAYQVGCMRALFAGKSPATSYRPFDPAVLTGTSAGALNAAFLLSAEVGTLVEAVNFAAEVWTREVADTPEKCGSGALRIRGNPLDFFDPACLADPGRLLSELAGDTAHLSRDFLRRGLNFFQSQGDWEQRAIELVDIEALISAQPTQALVRRRVHPEAIRRSARTLRLAATNWKTGKLRIFTNEDMTDENGHNIVLASAALPGVFPTVEIDGYPYADGGLVMNTPLKPAISAGATTIHVIYMDPDAVNLPLPRIRNTAATFYRFSIVTLAAMLDRDIQTVRQVNLGLEVAGGNATDALSGDRAAVLTAGKKRFRKIVQQAPEYRPITIHRYNPTGSLGVGLFGWLTFEIDQIKRLMDLGYSDTLFHDCERSGCILPD